MKTKIKFLLKLKKFHNFIWVMGVFLIILSMISIYLHYWFINQGKVSINSNSPHFAVLPHHWITGEKLQEFYKLLVQKYPKINKILIISPNHFNAWGGFAIWTPTNNKICFNNSCIDWIKLSGFEPKDSDFPLFKTSKESDIFTTQEHWIWIHIGYINKYFGKFN